MMEGEVACSLLTNTVRKCSELEVTVLELVVLRASPIANIRRGTCSSLLILGQNTSMLIVCLDSLALLLSVLSFILTGSSLGA